MSSTTPSVVDDDPPHVALQRRLQHVFGRDDDAAVGLATGPGQIGERQIVGERDQPVPGEQRLERLDVAHDVDDRLRSRASGGHRRRRPEDLQQRIETTLRIGPWQQRRRRIRAVQFGASGDVGAELVFDEPLEDAQHLRRVQRPPSARPQVDDNR